MKKVDFSGQHIYVGMDIGKKSWKVCMLTEELGAGSCNDSPIQNQSNQNKIDVIKNLTFSVTESEDDILCELELK